MTCSRGCETVCGLQIRTTPGMAVSQVNKSVHKPYPHVVSKPACTAGASDINEPNRD